MDHVDHFDAFYNPPVGVSMIVVVCHDCVEELMNNDNTNYFFHASDLANIIAAN